MGVALALKKWTLEELHRLPEDGNKYEVIRGALFVTPPPGERHERIAARLNELLAPFVRAHGLGVVFRPKAVMRFDASEVEPDLMVRQPHPDPQDNDRDWDTAPTPILVVEILSAYTRRRDSNEKKRLYRDAGVEEYWVVDPETRAITVNTAQDARTDTERLTWAPHNATSSLVVDVADLFQA